MGLLELIDFCAITLAPVSWFSSTVSYTIILSTEKRIISQDFNSTLNYECNTTFTCLNKRKDSMLLSITVLIYSCKQLRVFMLGANQSPQ